ncbi:helicase associated domain-containing protein [Octadecabacter sp.]|nr:helicase associated domain-containing protein [Octadecabacter sp.]
MAKNTSQNRESISDKIIFDMPVSVDADFSSALRTVLVEASTASWEFWFGLLEQFKELEGHCRVPQSYKLDGFKLGGWVATHRGAQDSMSPERKQRLDAIGFVWDPYAEDWEVGFSKLVQFKETEQHMRVTNTTKLDGFKLGFWVANQRSLQGMTPERKQRLDEIDFVWDVIAESWEEGFSKLVQFKETEQHVRVPIASKLDGFNLGRWVDRQRTDRERLSPERKQLLDDMGFVWSIIEEKWEEAFNKLVQFKEAVGDCKVPQRQEIDGFKLGQWVTVQRTTKDHMSPERKQRLDDVGFVWDVLTEQWEKAFSRLQQFQKTEGHCRVPDKHEFGGFRLGKWVGKQRQKRDRMSPERKQRLDDLGFIWDARKDQP